VNLRPASGGRNLRRTPRQALAFLAALAVGSAAPAASAVEPPDLAPSGILIPISQRVEGLQWTIGGKSAIAGFVSGNTNFGAGRIDPDGSNTGDTSWFEGYLLPNTRFVFGERGFGSFYGTVAPVFTLTRGEGDAAGFTSSPNWDADVEELLLGWNSGDLLHPRNSIDVSLGRQEFHIGDEFLIGNGNFDADRDGIFWLGPRRSFDRAAIVRLGTAPAFGSRRGFALQRGVDTEPVRGDLFYLRGDRDFESTELVGGNLEYANGRLLGRWENFYLGGAESGRLGLTYVRVIDSDENFKARKGMNAINVWANHVRILEGVRGVPDLFLWGGYAREWGGENVDIDASAWYAELGMRLERLLPGAPSLRYRYSRFSGDGDPADTTSRGYDPFFYGPTPNRGAPYGTWYQGEIVGEYLLFNTNLRAHMVHLNFWLEPGSHGRELSLGLIYYNFLLDSEQYKGTPVTSRAFAHELDATALWKRTFLGKLYVELSAVFAVAWPREAARQAFGSDEPYWLFEAYAFVQF
jgi:hypothetical protein